MSDSTYVITLIFITGLFIHMCQFKQAELKRSGLVVMFISAVCALSSFLYATQPWYQRHFIVQPLYYNALPSIIPPLKEYLWIACIASFVFLISRLFLYRTIKIWWKRLIFGSRKEFNENDQRKINLKFKPYLVGKYFYRTKIDAFFGINKHKGTSFFLGRKHKDKSPVYATEKDMSHHVNVSGATGSGKTESVLKPIAIQNAHFGNPTIFIDGKADQNLIQTFTSFSKNETNRKFYNFNSIQVEDEGKMLDVLKTSHTFNPLMAFNDASRLTGMLTMALELESDGAENFYFDLQKAFLMRLFNLFLAIGKPFTFEDIAEFIMYAESRKHTYKLAVEKGRKEEISSMSTILDKLKNGFPELLGLYNKIDQLFVSDALISKLVNVYDSDINLKQSLKNKDFVLFSVSCGDRFQSNQAISKMVISILNTLVGEKVGYEERPFWMLILDEFGTYTTSALSPLITTARDTNTSIVLSYQTSALLENVNGLADIVKSCTGIKFIFNSAESADDHAKYFGTIQSTKKTYVMEEDSFATESIQGRASNREVDVFNIPPNVFRSLLPGQSVCKYPSSSSGMTSAIVNHAMIHIGKEKFRLNREQDSSNGLNLKYHRLYKTEKGATTLDKNEKKVNPDAQVSHIATKAEKEPVVDEGGI